MQTLFSSLLMILGTINANFVPVLLAVNAVTENVDFAACLLGSAEAFSGSGGAPRSCRPPARGRPPLLGGRGDRQQRTAA